MTPPHRDVPERDRAGHGEHRALPPGHAQVLGDRVGGEQRHGRQGDLVRPGQQPRGRVGMVHALDLDGQPGRLDDGHDRDEDHGRARQGNQRGGLGIQAAEVQVDEPLRRDQRPPQVVRQPPGVPPDQQRAPRGGDHSDRDEPGRGDERKQSPNEPRPAPGQRCDVPSPGAVNPQDSERDAPGVTATSGRRRRGRTRGHRWPRFTRHAAGEPARRPAGPRPSRRPARPGRPTG